MALDDIDGIQIIGVDAVTSQHLPCEVTLQRREAEAVVLVTLEDELNEMIAQSANTIVKNNWIGFSLRQVGGLGAHGSVI